MDGLWGGWWSLKGPANWCATIGADTADGRSVVIVAPHGIPPGARDALLKVCSGDGSSMVMIDEAGTRQPVQLLVEALDIPTDGGSSTSLAWIPALLATHRRLIWVTGIAREHWPAWAALLPGWGHAVRSLPEYARPVLVVMLPPGCEPPASDSALQIRRWGWNQVEADIPAWDRHVGDGNGLSIIERIESAQRISVAGWDPAVIVALRAAKETGAIIKALKDHAAARGWSAQTPGSWMMGVLPEGATCLDRAHPAWLAATNRTQEIERRIWSAQLSVVMPAIENRRLAWVRAFTQQLRLPWETRFGTIIDPVEVEIGLLAYQVRKGFIRAGTDGSLIELAAQIRNDLAHGRLIQPAIIEQIFRVRDKAGRVSSV